MWDVPQNGRVLPVGSHLEDGRGFLVVVQDGVGVVPPSTRHLERVADLDDNVGEAVPLTKLWVGRTERS